MASHESDPRSQSRTGAINWYDGWRFSSTGPVGFWHHERPVEHFRTASGATGLVARMLLALLAGRPEISTIVDIGAGDGRLLFEIGALAPRMRLIGLDLRPAPVKSADAASTFTPAATSTSASTATSPKAPTPTHPLAHTPTVEWIRGHWDVDSQAWLLVDRSEFRAVPLQTLVPAEQPAVIVAAEWLDELPLVVAECEPDGWRQVRVGPDGSEAAGPPVPGADAEWLGRWWPGTTGGRGESGRTRDRAWREVIDCLMATGGLAVMIDYGHRLPNRPVGGTLTGFQHGRQVPPRPSPTINLTAHVAVDSVQRAGEHAGARTELLISQREAVERLLPTPALTDRTSGDALSRLEAAGERRLLAETLGDHFWLVQSVRPERRARRPER